MTEKVVSLSGGLVLGMAFALFLSVSTTQTVTSPMHMEYPSVSGLIGLNDLQSYRSSSPGQVSDTTPAVSVAPPAQDEDRGRIVRIATVTETVDPVLTAHATVTTASDLPKNFSTAGANVDRASTLQQMHQQHSFIERNTTGNYSMVTQIARQSNNFSAIADNGQGPGYSNSGGGDQPSVIDNKPHTSGSPSIAHNDPGGEGSEEDGPSLTGHSPKPSGPDDVNDTERHHVEPYNPSETHNYHGVGGNSGNHPSQNGPQGFQQGHGPRTS